MFDKLKIKKINKILIFNQIKNINHILNTALSDVIPLNMKVLFKGEY